MHAGGFEVTSGSQARERQGDHRGMVGKGLALHHVAPHLPATPTIQTGGHV